MSKLIVLITNSDFDLGQIANRVKQDITYIDCDTGGWDPELTKCENLLAIIELHPSREKTAYNAITDDDKQHNNICFTNVLKECRNYQTVAGVHGISPDKVLAISQFPDVQVTNYSTYPQQFQFIESWFKEFAKEEPNSEKIKQAFLALFEILNKSPIDKLFIHFLPLDIDMQALEIIKDDAGKIEKYLWGDKDIEGMFESREGDEHYRQKLYGLWHLLGKKDYLRQIGKKPSSKVEHLAPIDNPSPCIQQLAGLENGNGEESPIYKFLESLDERKKVGNDLKEDVDYLLTPFKSIELKIGDDEINSFQDWYCALASCLRGAKGCEGK